MLGSLESMCSAMWQPTSSKHAEDTNNYQRMGAQDRVAQQRTIVPRHNAPRSTASSSQQPIIPIPSTPCATQPRGRYVMFGYDEEDGMFIRHCVPAISADDPGVPFATDAFSARFHSRFVPFVFHGTVTQAFVSAHTGTLAAVRLNAHPALSSPTSSQPYYAELILTITRPGENNTAEVVEIARELVNVAHGASNNAHTVTLATNAASVSAGERMELTVKCTGSGPIEVPVFHATTRDHLPDLVAFAEWEHSSSTPSTDPKGFIKATIFGNVDMGAETGRLVWTPHNTLRLETTASTANSDAFRPGTVLKSTNNGSLELAS